MSFLIFPLSSSCVLLTSKWQTHIVRNLLQSNHICSFSQFPVSRADPGRKRGARRPWFLYKSVCVNERILGERSLDRAFIAALKPSIGPNAGTPLRRIKNPALSNLWHTNSSIIYHYSKRLNPFSIFFWAKQKVGKLLWFLKAFSSLLGIKWRWA